MKYYFTSDAHWFHKNICKFTKRLTPEATVEEHTEWLVGLWNSQVSKNDTVFHMGDFAFHNKSFDLIPLVKRLNGTKEFIKGNHDSSKAMKSLYAEGCIKSIDEYRVINLERQQIVLFHFPIASWYNQHRGSWHLCGHSHGNLKQEHSQGKILDVGIDNAFEVLGEHRFFTLEDIKGYMDSRPIYIADKHEDRN